MDEKNKHSYAHISIFAEQEEVEEMGRRGCVWLWGAAVAMVGAFCKADREGEMEHVAYREISAECSLANAPLYPRCNRNSLHLLCPCQRVFLGNKGCAGILGRLRLRAETVKITVCDTSGRAELLPPPPLFVLFS